MVADMWETLLPVIVGGGIGLIGGLAGPPLSHILLRKAERKKLRREKFEQLLGLLYEHDHWLNLMRNIIVFGEEDTHPVEPLPKAKAIATMYFADLKQDLETLDRATRSYKIWMHQAGLKRVSGSMTEISVGSEEAYGEFLAEFRKLTEKLEEYDYR